MFQAIRALCEHLVSVPICLNHHACDVLDIFVRDAGMKEIAHAVYKHSAWSGPLEWIAQFFRNESKIEASLIGMTRYTTEAFGERFRIAMFTSRADFSAAP